MKKTLFVFVLTAIIVLSTSVSYANEISVEYQIPPVYSDAGTFNEYGIAQVTDQNGNTGVINVNGEKVFGFDGTMFHIRRNGLIMALDSNDMAAFFDSKGNQLTDYIYDAYVDTHPKTREKNYYFLNNDYDDGDDSTDFIRISRNKKFGYMNSKGEEVIPPIYEYVYGFYKGISMTGGGGILSAYGTYTAGKFGYIDKYGNTIYPADSLWAAENFKNYDVVTIADGQYKALEYTGNLVDFDTKKYTNITGKGNFVRAYNANTGLISLYNKSGKQIHQDTYHSVEIFGNVAVIHGTEVINKNGEVLHSFKDGTRCNIWTSDNEYIKISTPYAQYEDRFGYMDMDGNIVFEPVYKNVDELFEGVFFVVDENDQRWLYDFEGEPICKLNGEVRSRNFSCGLLPVLDYDTMKYGYIKNPLSDYKKKIKEFTDNDTINIEETIKTEYGTVFVYHISGAPHHSGPMIKFINHSGEEYLFSANVPRINFYSNASPSNIKLSEDGKYLEFQYEFSDRAKVEDMNLLLHNEGTYYYKAELETAKSYEEAFVPKTYASREMAIKLILDNSSLKDIDANLATVENYGDIVNFSDERKANAAKAIENKILLGYTDNKLNLNDNITRAELACMIYRAQDFFDFKSVDQAIYKGQYSDLSEWNAKEIKFCIENGIMIGYGDIFGANDNLTVEQVNIILERFKNGLTESEKQALLEILG